MYDGTLSADWQAMIVFQQFIVLADSEGVVDITPPSISRRTGIPLDIIEYGIKKLEEADPYSRSPNNDGRRITLIDDHRPWGWEIVNYEFYRDLASREDKREKAKERKRDQRERQKDTQVTDSIKASHDVTRSHAQSRMSRHVDVDVNTDVNKNICAFSAFWKLYPVKKQKKTADAIWHRKKLDNKAEEIITALQNQIQNDSQWSAGYVPNPTTYLNQERWTDEISRGSNQSQQTKSEQSKQALRQWVDQG